MPLYYNILSGATTTTNAAANTANDFFFVKPGTRTVWLCRVNLQGRSVSATTLSGLSIRIEKWITTASTGSAVTPTPDDPGYQASKCTAGLSATTVTSGTGGPTLLKSFGCSKTGPGGWIGLPTLDDCPSLEGSATQSIDGFNVTGDSSLPFEADFQVAE